MPMAVIVQKYGGSSVADVEKIQQVADKVVRTVQRGHRVVVVVSAMARTTDSLLELAKRAATVDGVHKPPARRELDMLVTTGERVSMALLSIAIQARGYEAISFTGSQCGIITNDQHFNARIIEVRPFRVEDELARGRIVIVAGYQGMSYRREITTLGRGGSDTTAVALAAALDAERCEIYSDVDGVYTADPRVVDDAVHLPEVDPEFLQNMAESGAKVINAQAVEWARRKGIALYARATFDPEDENGLPPRQTIVRKSVPTNDNRIRAITVQKHAAWIAFPVGMDSRRMAEALAWLQGKGVPVWSLTANAQGLSLLVPLDNVPDSVQKMAEWRESPLWSDAELDDSVAVVSVIGHNLGDSVGTTAAVHRALTEAGISVRQVGANPMRVHAALPRKDADQAQRILHELFVSSRA